VIVVAAISRYLVSSNLASLANNGGKTKRFDDDEYAEAIDRSSKDSLS
jgi:hypothetical protein